MPLTQQDIDRLNAAQQGRGEGPSNIQVTPDSSSSPWDPATAGVPQRTAPPYPISATQAAQRGYDPTGQSLASRTGQPLAAATEQGGGALGGLHSAWNDFIDHPENRAGMMQFAVNMLSGQPFGQAVGGAAEAAGRSVSKQQEEEQAEEKEALAEAAQKTKESEAESYGIMARKKSPQEDYFNKLDARTAAEEQKKKESEFRAWVADPGTNSPAVSPITKEVMRKFPNFNKTNIYDPANAEALKYARQLHGLDVPNIPAGAQPVYDQKTKVLKGYWDGKKFTPGEPTG